MSGHSYTNNCPNCGNPADFYSDHKPFELVQFDCLDCGVYSKITLHQQNLNDLNESRKERSDDFVVFGEKDETYKPLKELPKVNENLKHWFEEQE
tara:strand:+ start:620 stop:904 length:285 start_codon:yes stop_codon:yes gene_type:complete